MNQINETFPQNNEQPKTQEELEVLLEEAKTRLSSEEKRAGEFYNIELYQVFEEAIKNFNSDSEVIRVYLDSIGKDYDQAEENLDKKMLFDRTYIRPIKKEIQEIENFLRAIKNKEYRLQQEQLEKESEQKEEEAFNKEKQQLETKLYEALSKIHDQIPKEAEDMGMTTESAMKVYLPDLVDHAHRLESLINQLSEARNSYELTLFKKDLAFSRIDL